MNSRKALDSKAVGCMLIFCSVLGLQQVSMKLASQDIAPVLLLSIRSAIAGILVWRREALQWRNGVWRAGVIILNEPLEPSFIIGSALALAGIILVSGYGWIKQKFL